jgi:hypothetical protein
VTNSRAASAILERLDLPRTAPLSARARDPTDLFADADVPDIDAAG